MKTQLRTIACSSILAAAFATVSAQTTFTRITTGPVVSDGADGEGCAWVDFDNDSDLDLYVSCDLTGSNLLYRNDAGGVFTKLTNGPIQSAGPGSIGAAWADFDNDGRIDLFVSRQNGRPSLLFPQQADGTFIRTNLPSGGFSRGAAWADYDNDGFLDLMVGDMTQNVLWRNSGEGTLVAVKDTSIVTTPNGSNLTWADYDNDGDSDLFGPLGSSKDQLRPESRFRAGDKRNRLRFQSKRAFSPTLGQHSAPLRATFVSHCQ